MYNPETEKIKYQLHYFDVDNYEEPNIYEFNEIYEIPFYLADNLPKIEVVYLISIFDEIFISDKLEFILQFIGFFYSINSNFDKDADNSFFAGYSSDFIKHGKSLYHNTGKKYDGIIYLQEYESFEAAYKVAIDMNEPNKLCYERI